MLTYNQYKQGEIIEFPTSIQELLSEEPAAKKIKTNSRYKSNGQPKATPADPFRSPEDVKKMQEYYLSKGQIRNYTLLTVGINFALRASDLLSLTVDDIYTDDDPADVVDSFALYEDKTNKRNIIHISPACKKVLLDYFYQIPDEMYGSDPVFFSGKLDAYGDKRPITLRQLNRILEDGAKAVGLPYHVSSHSLRKTFAYWAINNHKGDQETLYTLQYLLNHTDIRTTFRYTGIETNKVAALRDEIGNLLL